MAGIYNAKIELKINDKKLELMIENITAFSKEDAVSHAIERIKNKLKIVIKEIKKEKNSFFIKLEINVLNSTISIQKNIYEENKEKAIKRFKYEITNSIVMSESFVSEMYS